MKWLYLVGALMIPLHYAALLAYWQGKYQRVRSSSDVWFSLFCAVLSVSWWPVSSAWVFYFTQRLRYGLRWRPAPPISHTAEERAW